MAKSITELFSRNSKIVPLPEHDGKPRDINDGTGSWVTTSQIDGNTDSYRDYLDDSINVLPPNTGVYTSNEEYEPLPPNDPANTGVYTSMEEYKLPPNDPANTGVYTSMEEYKMHLLAVDIKDAIRKIGSTLARYKQFKNDPAAYMSLFGGLLPININMSETGVSTYNTLNELADKVGLGLPGIVPNGVIPIPAYMSYEDGRLINAAMNTIQSTIMSAVGGRLRPNYEMLFLTQTGGDLMNSVLNLLTDDFFKKEFEKGRLPWQMPGTDLNAHTWSIYKSQGDGSSTNSDDLWSAVKGVITDAIDDMMQKQDSNAADILYGKSELKEEVIKEYTDIRDPYGSKSTQRNVGNINDIFEELSKDDLLRGYKDYAGFELGSNHNWLIKLRPYSSPNRKTVTPPLPVYALPNLWTSSNSITSTLFDPKTNSEGKNGGWNKLINSWTDRIIDNTFNRLTFGGMINDMPSDSSLGGVLMDAVQNAIWGGDDSTGNSNEQLFRYFSFSKHTPVISYDLNFGTIRTESQRLFNGSSVEMFSGMQFNSTLNMSILDDAYHSMYKYMIEYTNRIYDVHTGAMAPYYSMAFEIELIIMRTGNKINHHYKFIGIPIEFTPRLDGSDQPNECRVDLTFGIIGLVKPPDLNSNVYSEDTLRRGYSKEYEGEGELKTSLKWKDIMINIGGNLSKE